MSGFPHTYYKCACAHRRSRVISIGNFFHISKKATVIYPGKGMCCTQEQKQKKHQKNKKPAGQGNNKQLQRLCNQCENLQVARISGENIKSCPATKFAGWPSTRSSWFYCSVVFRTFIIYYSAIFATMFSLHLCILIFLNYCGNPIFMGVKKRLFLKNRHIHTLPSQTHF